MRYDEVVDGKVFRAYHDETIAADGTLAFQFTTPLNKTVIFEQINVTSISENVRLQSFENVTLDDGTTPVHVINSNFQTDVEPNTILTSDPTNISGGDLKSSILIPAITSGPSLKTISPFTITDDNFSILKPGTNYIIELQNQNPDTETLVDIQILFREL